jgi:restriction endonuclease S subunit
MVNDIIGTTPADWQEVALGDFCDLIAGSSILDDPQGAVPVVKPRNLSAGRVSGSTDHTNSAEAANKQRYRIRAGDLLSARTGSVGRVSLTTGEQEGWLFSTGIICIRPNESADPLFLSLYLSHPAIKEWFINHSTGTAIPSINTKTLGTLPVSLPPLALQRAIGGTLDALNQKIAAHKSICLATAELRDMLLPLLVSGQVAPAPQP